MSLPGDIRKRIYRHLFICDKPGEELKLDYKPGPTREYRTPSGVYVEIYEDWHKYIAPSSKKLRTELSLLLTCRDVEKELDDIVFGYSKLLFIHPKALWRFSNMVPDAGLATIRSIKLQMSIYDLEYEQLWFTVIKDFVIAKFTGLKSLDVAIKYSPNILSKTLLPFNTMALAAGLATIRTLKLEVSIREEEYQKLCFAAIKYVVFTKLTGLKSLDIVIWFSRHLWNGYKDFRCQQWKDALEVLDTLKLLQEGRLTPYNSQRAGSTHQFSLRDHQSEITEQTGTRSVLGTKTGLRERRSGSNATESLNGSLH